MSIIHRDYLGVRPVKGDVGIEIEVEGDNLPSEIETPLWKAVEDHSLRDGMEYVNKGAIPVETVPKAMEFLHKMFTDAGSRLEFSTRTSVHVHVNCLEMTHKQILTYLYAAILLQDTLVSFCGESREGNRFCLRLRDAEGIMTTLSALYKGFERSSVNFRIMDEHAIRYAAINIFPLMKYGTIEFRSMRGTTDSAIIIPWVETLVNIREASKEFASPSAVASFLDSQGAFEFCSKFLGKHVDLFYSPRTRGELAMNYSLSIELPYIADASTSVDPKELIQEAIDKFHPGLRTYLRSERMTYRDAELFDFFHKREDEPRYMTIYNTVRARAAGSVNISDTSEFEYLMEEVQGDDIDD